ncbi:MAG: glycosyltransferase family 4 protein [Bacteroidota bacterium]
MSADHLHIISLDVPYPADYGGVIDIFYKLKALHACGVKIQLHCYQSTRQQAKELEQYCESVHYYPRTKSLDRFLGPLPFIVQSRSSELLRSRLMQDEAPILMEGLHSTFLLSDPAFFRRKCIVRTHNVEHDYYKGLSDVESRSIKRWYLRLEARRLKRYEPVLMKASSIAAISPEDTSYFNGKYGNTFYLPAFHPFDRVEIDPAADDFAFYHGNLAVGENNRAALFLVKEVFSDLPYRLIIAGSRPSAELRNAVAGHSNVQLLDSLSPAEIHRHISRAKVNVLPTFQSTGIKLKLLAALFCGKTCLVNSPMVQDTGLETLCNIEDGSVGFKRALTEIFSHDAWHPEQVEERKRVLESMFSNKANAMALKSRLFG